MHILHKQNVDLHQTKKLTNCLSPILRVCNYTEGEQWNLRPCSHHVV